MAEGGRKKNSGKREQIVETAERLFTRHGARRVTVEEICREAGVSKMTFYKHFVNKTELVRSIKQAWMEEGFRKFDEIKAMDIPYPEKIQVMTRWKVEFTSRLNVEFIKEMTSSDEEMAEVKRRYLANIAEAQRDGAIRSDINPEFLWLVVEKLNELAAAGRWKEVFTDFSQYQEQMRTLLYFGLLSRQDELK